MEQITQKHLARLLGLSQTTVSRAVNDSPLLKDETRKTVLVQIEKLGYVPNSLAKALRGGKTNTVGLILPSLSYLEGYNTARIVSGLGSTASSFNYDLIITAFSKFSSKTKIIQEIIRKRKLDGVFAIFDSITVDEDFLSFIHETKTSFVFVNSNRWEKGFYSVGSDNSGGVYRATNHLIKKGYRKILFFGKDPQRLIASERFEGYRRALKEHNISYFKTVDTGNCSDLLKIGYQKTLSILKDSKQPEAIICYSDQIAIGVLKAAVELGFKVPGNIGLIGFGDINESAYTNPPLTTIRENGFQVGKAAMEMMVRLLSGEKPQEGHSQIKTELILRNSA